MGEKKKGDFEEFCENGSAHGIVYLSSHEAIGIKVFWVTIQTMNIAFREKLHVNWCINA